MGTIIGLFTAGSLANMDKYNPKKQVLGHRLRTGVRLLVVWNYGTPPLYYVFLH